MSKYPSLIAMPTNRRKRKQYFGSKPPGSVVDHRKLGPCIVQFNGELRPVRSGELKEPYHQKKAR